MQKKRFTIPIIFLANEKMAKEIKEIADNREVSTSSVIRELLSEALSDKLSTSINSN